MKEPKLKHNRYTLKRLTALYSFIVFMACALVITVLVFRELKTRIPTPENTVLIDIHYPLDITLTAEEEKQLINLLNECELQIAVGSQWQFPNYQIGLRGIINLHVWKNNRWKVYDIYLSDYSEMVGEQDGPLRYHIIGAEKLISYLERVKNYS